MTLAATPSLKQIVSQEFEAFIQRCCARGLEREEAINELHFSLNVAALDRSIAEREAKEAPFKSLLEQGHACHRAGDMAGAKRFAAEWLSTKHDVRIGDAVRVSAWVVPREITLADFHISWDRAENAEDGFLWFEGPLLNPNSSIRGELSHGAPMDAPVMKVRSR